MKSDRLLNISLAIPGSCLGEPKRSSKIVEVWGNIETWSMNVRIRDCGWMRVGIQKVGPCGMRRCFVKYISGLSDG